MSTLTPLGSMFPVKPLKHIAPLRGDKVDAVPMGGEYLGLEQLESWTGRLSGAVLGSHPEGGANVFRGGDVLFGKLRPYLAKAWTADREGYCSTESLVLSPLDASPGYLRYCLLTREVIAAIDGSTYGAKMPRADWSFVGALRMPFPSRSRQDRIANFLDGQTARIDALIAEKERLIQVLDISTAELLHAWVTKGLGSNPLKSSGREWMGGIPSHWSAPYIRFVARIESGHTPSRQHPEYWVHCSVPWFTLADVWQLRDGRQEVVTDTAEMVSDLGLANSSARLLPAGTVMLSRTASVGFSAIMGTAMATTQDFVNWVCGPKVLPEYLLYVLRSMGAEFERLKYGSTHSTIYMPDIAKLTMPLPPLEEQHVIVRDLRVRKAKMDELGELARDEVERLREYRSSLISAAVRGQLDLDSDPAPIEKGA